MIPPPTPVAAMPHAPASPVGRLRFVFRHHTAVSPELDKPIRDNLSAIEVVGRCLFAGADEGARVERLVTRDGTTYAGHESFPLADFFDLPAGPEGEADVEGLAVDGGWLWVVGSHSLARRQPKSGVHDPAEALARLTEVKRDPNRCLLGRIPLVKAGGKGVYTPVRSDGVRTAACLKMGRKRNALAKLLKRDEHIGRFIGVPAKENGFDVEGIAARGDRVFLGLRGPVLRGWACLLELTVGEKRPGRLELRPTALSGRLYAKHFLDLDGLGIRELALDGDDLLILSGPTMDLDGPVTLWRWAGALDATEQRVVPRTALARVLDLPYGTGFDHPEGIARLTGPEEGPLIAVAYDNPGRHRRHGDGDGDDATVDADLFALESAPENAPDRE